MQDLPCPCCGFLTLEGEYGSYVICDVCGWEDDAVQLANPTSEGGANKKSLAGAQQSLLQKYPVGVFLAEGHRRSVKWRPMSLQEVTMADERKAGKHWYAKAILVESEAYWSSNQVGAL